MEIHSLSEKRLSLLGVAGTNITSVKDFVEMHLLRIFEKSSSGEYYTIESIFDMIENREMQLWVILKGNGAKGICITQINVWPKVRRLSVPFASGEDLDDKDMEEIFSILEEFARYHNCNQVGGSGRIGWLRKIDRDWEKENIFYYEMRSDNVIH